VLGEVDLLATERGERQVGNSEVAAQSREDARAKRSKCTAQSASTTADASNR
jgi:hypothetical protein